MGMVVLGVAAVDRRRGMIGSVRFWTKRVHGIRGFGVPAEWHCH